MFNLNKIMDYCFEIGVALGLTKTKICSRWIFRQNNSDMLYFKNRRNLL